MEFKKTVLAGILLYAAWGASYIAVPLYLDSLGISLESMGWLFGAAGIITGLALFAIGAHADVMGRKTFASVFTLLNSLAYGAYALVGSFAPLALVRGASDFFHTASFNMLTAKVIDASHRERLARNFGYFFGFASIFSAVVIALAGFMLAAAGFGAVFLAIAAIAALSFLTTLAFRRERMEKGRVELSLGVLRDRDAAVFSLSKLVSGFSFALVIFAEPLFFKYVLGFANEQVGLVMAGSWLAFGLANAALGWLADRYGSRMTFLACCALEGVAWTAMVLVADRALAVALYILGSAAMGVAIAASFRMGALIPRREDMARDTAVFGYAFSIGSIAGMFAAGYVAEISLALNFVARGATLVLSALIALGLSKRAD